VREHAARQRVLQALACLRMGVARVCVCPVHNNAIEVLSMIRNGLWTWCAGCVLSQQGALKQAHYTAQVPAPGSAGSSIGWVLGLCTLWQV